MQDIALNKPGFVLASEEKIIRRVDNVHVHLASNSSMDFMDNHPFDLLPVGESSSLTLTTMRLVVSWFAAHPRHKLHHFSTTGVTAWTEIPVYEYATKPLLGTLRTATSEYEALVLLNSGITLKVTARKRGVASKSAYQEKVIQLSQLLTESLTLLNTSYTDQYAKSVREGCTSPTHRL